MSKSEHGAISESILKPAYRKEVSQIDTCDILLFSWFMKSQPQILTTEKTQLIPKLLISNTPWKPKTRVGNLKSKIHP